MTTKTINDYDFGSEKTKALEFYNKQVQANKRSGIVMAENAALSTTLFVFIEFPSLRKGA